MAVHENIPQHVAMIMDGNGRWATQRGFKTIEGHRKGAHTAEHIAVQAQKMGIRYLTLYTFSTENFNRSPLWINELMEEFAFFLEHKTHIFTYNRIKASFIGERGLFSSRIQGLITSLEENTKAFDGLHVIFAFGYGGRHDIVRAAERIALDVASKNLLPENITEEVFSSYLYTKDIPDPDLFIRTSGDMRISNYLLWQMAYTELAFTQTLWPDFTAKEFQSIVESFAGRQRCYGGDRKVA